LLPETVHGEVVRHDVGEDRVLSANVLVSWIGKAAVRFRVLFVLREYLNDFLRLRVGRRSEEHRVEEAEDRSVGADAEGEDDYCRGREPGRLVELPEGEL